MPPLVQQESPRRPSLSLPDAGGLGLFVRPMPAQARQGWINLMRRDAIRKRHPSGEGFVLARRKPRLLLRLPGSFLLRYAERQLSASLFQLPPRLTRLEPVSCQPNHSESLSPFAAVRCKVSAWLTWANRLATAFVKSAMPSLPAR